MCSLATLFLAAVLGAEAPAPTSLIASAGDGAAYLEWNPPAGVQAAGYHVYRRMAGEVRFARVTDKPVPTAQYTDRRLLNGFRYEYAVAAISADGAESARSNAAEARPRPSRAPIVERGPAVVEIPGAPPVRVANALRATFQYGHSIVFDADLARVRDWQTEDGVHLLSPAALPDAPVRFIGYRVQETAITFHWVLPASGQREFRETWAPVRRRIGATEYRGLERRIEVAYSACDGGCPLRFSDAFAPGGTADGAMTRDAGGPAGDLFLFAAFPRGTLLVAPRRYRFKTTHEWIRGAGTLEARIVVALPAAGGRLPVESFEYLWSPGAEPDQRFERAADYYHRNRAALLTHEP